jgi:hypothetical protein
MIEAILAEHALSMTALDAIALRATVLTGKATVYQWLHHNERMIYHASTRSSGTNQDCNAASTAVVIASTEPIPSIRE